MSSSVDSATGCSRAQSCSVPSGVAMSSPLRLGRSGVHHLDLYGWRRDTIAIEQRRRRVQACGEATRFEHTDFVFHLLVLEVEFVVALDVVLAGGAAAHDGVRVQRRCRQNVI